jgi:hypothetical protein
MGGLLGQGEDVFSGHPVIDTQVRAHFKDLNGEGAQVDTLRELGTVAK